MSENPHQSPGTQSAMMADDAMIGAPVDAKAIALRWERARIQFNCFNLVAGVIMLFVVGGLGTPLGTWFRCVNFALATNALYCFGPLGEMYLAWWTESRGDRAPLRLRRMLASGQVTRLFYAMGLACALFIAWVGFLRAAFGILL